jgi:hypothetical protein
MSKKDVLHIPPTAVPPAPERSADPDDGGPHVPPMRPFEGPGGTPSEQGSPRIITPQPSSDPYPGVHVH